MKERKKKNQRMIGKNKNIKRKRWKERKKEGKKERKKIE